MLKIFRRHSVPVLPVIPAEIFTDIRPHPSPPHATGWKPMKVYPLLNEPESPKHVTPVLGGLYTPFVAKIIEKGELQTLKGLLCNPITRIQPSSEMANKAVIYGHFDIVKFLHHFFGILPTERAVKAAVVRQDIPTVRFIKAWSGRNYKGVWQK